MPRATSLSDVARLAGVSVMTASRVLNKPELVEPSTRQKVLQALDKLGYVRQGAARALRTHRYHTIGAAIPTVNHAYFAGAIDALQEALRSAGYSLLLTSFGYDLKIELASVRTLIERGIDGLVLVGLDHDPRLFALLDAFSIPYVVIWTIDAARIHPCAGFDNRQAMFNITRHLLELGHTRFAVVTMPLAGNDRARERVAGVAGALSASGIALPPEKILEVDVSTGTGRDAAEDILQRFSDTTAIVCANDMLAAGAIAQCTAHGLRIPADMSITGFGNLDVAPVLTPALTTVSVPAREMGQHAAGYLIGRLDGNAPTAFHELPAAVVLRASTARCPAHRSKSKR